MTDQKDRFYVGARERERAGGIPQAIINARVDFKMGVKAGY